MPSPATILEAKHIRKEFPGVLALDDVSLRINSGEVLAIVGENGAGKSTLMKILAGVYIPDAGELLLNGVPVHFKTPAQAIRAGVALIHQELNLAENLSVLDNLFLGRELLLDPIFGLLNRSAMAKAGLKLLEKVGLAADFLKREVSTLSPGHKQLIEIARALGQNARVIIMDEPTSSLTQTETDRLYEVIDALRADGVAVLYISHRLAEVKRCCDRAFVLRDGRYSGELTKDEISHASLIKLMVGRDLKQLFPKNRKLIADKPVFRISELHYKGGPAHSVSLEIRPGEILGMSGLVGAGRTELSEAVFGLRRITKGQVEVAGKTVAIRTPNNAIHAGILLVPEDRRLNGLVLEESVGFNLSLPNLSRLSVFGWILTSHEAQLHAKMIQQLGIRTPSASKVVGLLSGGNQQKVVFGKWLERGPKVLILDEPTRGVDVGAKAEIYKLIDELASQGIAIWMISSDLEELLGMSDRVAVLHEGRLAGVLEGPLLTEQAVMTLATGNALS
jgi:ribose transport system ATP-binding protein